MEEKFDLLASLFLWVHVTSVIAFIIGVVGSYVAFYQAARETDIKAAQSLVKLSGWFGKYLGSPGITILFFAGILTAWRENVPMLGFLQGSDVNWLLASIVLLFSTYPLMFLVYNPRGKVLDKELENGVAKGEVTQGLKNAFADKTVRNWHIIELATYAVIIFLMVVKPF